jgi:hypothetical protein
MRWINSMLPTHAGTCFFIYLGDFAFLFSRGTCTSGTQARRGGFSGVGALTARGNCDARAIYTTHAHAHAFTSQQPIYFLIIYQAASRTRT